MPNLQLQLINTVSTSSTKNLETSSDFERAKKIVVKDKIILSIDFKKYKEGIVWDDFEELSIEVKGKLNELAYYASILISLKEIVDGFGSLDYSDNNKILRYAEDAYKIINNITEPKYLLALVLNKQRHLENLDHTIKREVEVLMHRKSTSQKQKNMLVYDAIQHLEADINDFISVLASFKVS